jgi:hypothetical protein
MSGASLSRPAVDSVFCFVAAASTSADGAGCSAAAATPFVATSIGHVTPSAQFGGRDDAAMAYSPGATLNAIRKITVRIFGLLCPANRVPDVCANDINAEWLSFAYPTHRMLI